MFDHSYETLKRSFFKERGIETAFASQNYLLVICAGKNDLF